MKRENKLSYCTGIHHLKHSSSLDSLLLCYPRGYFPLDNLGVEEKLMAMFIETSMKQLKASSLVQCLHFITRIYIDSLTEDLELHLTLPQSPSHTQ